MIRLTILTIAFAVALHLVDRCCAGLAALHTGEITFQGHQP